jgi:hypothetical protein
MRGVFSQFEHSNTLASATGDDYACVGQIKLYPRLPTTETAADLMCNAEARAVESQHCTAKVTDQALGCALQASASVTTWTATTRVRAGRSWSQVPSHVSQPSHAAQPRTFTHHLQLPCWCYTGYTSNHNYICTGTRKQANLPAVVYQNIVNCQENFSKASRRQQTSAQQNGHCLVSKLAIAPPTTCMHSTLATTGLLL